VAIGRTLIPQRPTLDARRGSADSPGAPRAWLSAAAVLVRRIVMVALAAFTILVLLPAAVAVQAAVPN